MLITVCIYTNIVLIVQELLWYEFRYAFDNVLSDIRLFAIIQQQIMLKELPLIFVNIHRYNNLCYDIVES